MLVVAEMLHSGGSRTAAVVVGDWRRISVPEQAASDPILGRTRGPHCWESGRQGLTPGVCTAVTAPGIFPSGSWTAYALKVAFPLAAHDVTLQSSASNGLQIFWGDCFLCSETAGGESAGLENCMSLTLRLLLSVAKNGPQPKLVWGSHHRAFFGWISGGVGYGSSQKTRLCFPCFLCLP